MTEEMERRRTAGIVIIAIFSLLGGIASGVLGFYAMQSPAIAQQHAYPVFLGIGVWGLITGIGLWRLRPLARLSAITFASFGCFVGIVAALIVATIVVKHPITGALADKLLAIAAIALLVAALNAWIVFYLNRARVAWRFIIPGTRGAALAARRPLSVSAIGGFLAVGGVMSTLMTFQQSEGALLGIPLYGLAAMGYYLGFGALMIGSGVMLWRLMPQALAVTFGFMIFSMANTLLMYVTPGGQAVMTQMENDGAARMSPQGAASLQNTYNVEMPIVVGTLFAVNIVMMILLYRHRRVFREHLPISSPGI